MPLTANDLPSRNILGHCPIDPLNETCEKFFQIWSHKAANISNDLIEYTIRRMQSDRLRFLFQTRNELTEQEGISPICQVSTHTEDDLRRIKERIRCFCLSTRNVYRHLRSDSRIYPKMCINLDQGIMIKVCRFIFKTKVLIKILSKEQHINEQQREQLKKFKMKQIDFNDPYRNVTKAFIVLQSNFEILFGDILDRDFFQNAKTAVQTLPIILDTSKTIRLIFCALYKLSEPERQAEVEAIRQRRSGYCDPGCRTKNQGTISPNIPLKTEENHKLKTINELLKINPPQATYSSLATPTQTVSNDKSTLELKTKTTESSRKIQSSKSQLNSPNTQVSKTNKNRPSSSTSVKRKINSPKKSPTTEKKKTKSPDQKSKTEKKSKSKNQNASTTYSTSLTPYNENSFDIKNINLFDQIHSSNQEKLSWTTWLENATLSLPTILPTDQNTNQTKPFLTTWALLDRMRNIL